MSQLDTSGSSWIRSVQYVRLTDGWKARSDATGFLVVDTDHGRYAWLVKPWVVGLIAAAQARGLGVGRTVNKLVKGKFASIKLDN